MRCRWCHEPKDAELDICFPCIFPEVREEGRADKRAELVEGIRQRLLESEVPKTAEERRIAWRAGLRVS